MKTKYEVQVPAQLLGRINAYAVELERRGVPVERVVLYGSHARGEARPDSDIDLAVFSEAFGPPDHAEFSGVLSAAKWDTEPMIEALGFNTRDLQDVRQVSFLHEIISTGRVVWRRREALP